MHKVLNGKKVLFLGIGFYDYDESIKETLTELGAEVDYYTELPNSFRLRIAQKLGKSFVDSIVITRHKYLLSSCSNDYDYIFIIKGYTLNKEFLLSLKSLNPKAKTILYQWDSLRRLNNFQEIKPFFDKIYSFDRVDCEENDELYFLPLFYRQRLTEQIKEFDFDISFIGWYHSDRFRIVKKINDYMTKNNLRQKFYISTGLITFFKLKDPIIKLKALKYNDYLDIVRRSRVVLDISHPDQTGLTMRTIELLASGKKIITTNSDIVNYDFYNKDNILVIDRENPIIDKSFIFSECNSNNVEFINRYSIESWLGEIFK